MNLYARTLASMHLRRWRVYAGLQWTANNQPFNLLLCISNVVWLFFCCFFPIFPHRHIEMIVRLHRLRTHRRECSAKDERTHHTMHCIKTMMIHFIFVVLRFRHTRCNVSSTPMRTQTHSATQWRRTKFNRSTWSHALLTSCWYRISLRCAQLDFTVLLI